MNNLKLALLNGGIVAALLGVGACSDAIVGEQELAEINDLCASGNLDRLHLRGALDGEYQPATYVTLGGRLVAFAAPFHNISLRAQDVLDESLDLAGVGSKDIEDWILVQSEADDPDCENGGCEGVFAQSGSFQVIEHSDELFRATFQLRQLRQWDGQMPGDRIEGSVEGCLVVEAP